MKMPKIKVDKNTAWNANKNIVDSATGGLLGSAGSGWADTIYDPLDLFGKQGDKVDAIDRQAEQQLNDSLSEFDALEQPTFDFDGFDSYSSVGDLTADETDLSFLDELDAALLGPSAMNDVKADPALKARQMASLGALDEIIKGGGMTATDQANLSRIQRQEAEADKGRRDAILQNMQMRGMSGGGQELLAQLQSSQAATDRQAQRGLDVAGMAQDRALEAMMTSGQLSSGMRDQDVREKSDIARANDEVARLNTAARNDMTKYRAGSKLTGSMANTAARNDAKKTTFLNNQDVANRNTDTANKSIEYGNTLKQQQFDNSRGVANDKATVRTGLADFQTKKADRLANEQANRLGTMTKLGTTAVSAFFSDENTKEDIQPISDAELDEFLNAFKPKKFKYKNPTTPMTMPGERAGFVAQDVKDTELGKELVQETPEGLLAVDRDNMDGIIMAALAKLAKEQK